MGQKIVGAIVVLLVVFGAGWSCSPFAEDSESPPPRALPPDLCVVVGDDLLNRLVPSALDPVADADNSSDTVVESSCDVTSDEAAPRGGPVAELSITVTRHGTAERAAKVFSYDLTSARDDTGYRAIEDFGDEGYLVGERKEYGPDEVKLEVRSGTDQVTIEYTAEPASLVLMEQAATTLAQLVLAKMGES